MKTTKSKTKNTMKKLRNLKDMVVGLLTIIWWAALMGAAPIITIVIFNTFFKQEKNNGDNGNIK